MNQDLYRDRGARLDTVVGEHKAYFAMLARIMVDHDINWNFQDWCAVQHGFRPRYDKEGMIIAELDIVDLQKYTLCVLKYGG